METSVTVLGSAVLALLLAGYFAQKYMPPPTPKIIGIDLGTTYSCVSVYEAVTGNVRVIPIDAKHLSMPSVVSYSGNNIRVGYDALKVAEKEPHNAIYDAKRFIGKHFTSSELQEALKGYPYKAVVENQTALFLVDNEHLRVTPASVSAVILDFLRNIAEKNLSVPITKAVMAVPADFDDFQRNVTKLAANMVGIDVIRIINEPTAAALAYGLHKKEGVNFVIVIDIGGGTTDVSLLNVQHGMFFTMAIAGNNHLGGQDFTVRLKNHIINLIESETNGIVTKPEKVYSIHRVSELLKLNFTSSLTELLVFPEGSVSDNVLSFNITRDTFENLNKDLFLKLLDVINLVLQEGNLSPQEVDEIVLVGGSTRIPKIRQMITKHFNRTPNTNIDPELAVSYGIAIQAGILGGMWPLQVSAIEIPRKMRKLEAN